MRLLSISDIHLTDSNMRKAVTCLPTFKNDWIILAGDISSKIEHIHFAFEQFTHKFKKVIWVPGNHDLWIKTNTRDELSSDDKYNSLVEICKEYNVISPEDDYIQFSTYEGAHYYIVPVFLLYDYSYAPENISSECAVAWAIEENVLCSDETFIKTKKFINVSEWCNERVLYTENRLARLDPTIPIILINHFPLIESLVRCDPHPRFKIWCGTNRTKNWHRKFNIKKVVYGHLHTPACDVIDETIFEEVSPPYPIKDFTNFKLETCLRQIIP